MRTNALLAILLVAVWTSAAHADGAARVAIIDTSRLFAPNGIAAWAQARAKLDAEQATYRAAESPDGQTPTRIGMPDLDLPPEQRERLKRKLDEIERKTSQERAWKTHVEQVLGPIRAATLAGLADYAKAHKIDLVLDRVEMGSAVLVAAPGVDITDAFIKDYNARQAKR